jgi:hypothetical protein
LKIVFYRRAITVLAAAIRMNAEGIKIQISGQNGAEMARSESTRKVVFLFYFRVDTIMFLQKRIPPCRIRVLSRGIMKGEAYGKRAITTLLDDQKTIR